MEKEKPPPALDESLLGEVLARRPQQDYRPRKPSQPTNAFISRIGEIASDLSRHPQRFKPAQPPPPGRGDAGKTEKQ